MAASEANTNSAGANLWGLFHDMGGMLAVAGAGLLALSVAYDYFFLLALGLSFNSVPTSITDHVRSAIVWVPKVAIFVFGFAVYELIMRRVEGGLTEDDLVRRSPAPRFTKWFRRSADIGLLVMGAVTAVAGTLLSTTLQGAFLGAMIVWGLLATSVVKHPRLGDKFTPLGARLFVLVPLAVIYVASFGYGSAHQMLVEPKSNWELTTTADNGINRRNVRGIRVFSEATVVVESTGKVSVIRSDAMITLTTLRKGTSVILNICRWFDVLCLAPKDPSPFAGAH